MQKVQEHKTTDKPKKKRVISVLPINKNEPWAFFDGASQGTPALGGAGGVLDMPDTSKICIKFAPGRGTNSKAELSALWAVLKTAQRKNVLRIQLYGDSKMVIDWANGKSQIKAPQLQYVLSEIKDVLTSFVSVSFTHIYRELNEEADILSKMALALQPGVLIEEEFRDGQLVEFFTVV